MQFHSHINAIKRNTQLWSLGCFIRHSQTSYFLRFQHAIIKFYRMEIWYNKLSSILYVYLSKQ